jgi:hypothetical protein
MYQLLQRIFSLVALVSCITTGHVKAQAMLWGGLVAGAAKETYAGQLINCRTYKKQSHKIWCNTVTRYKIGEYNVPADLFFFKSRLKGVNLTMKDENCDLKNKVEKECLRKYTLTLNKVVRALNREYGVPKSFHYGSRYNRNDRSLIATWDKEEVSVYVMANGDNAFIFINQTYGSKVLK